MTKNQFWRGSKFFRFFHSDRPLTGFSWFEVFETSELLIDLSRIGHHSTSDDSSAYRSVDEVIWHWIYHAIWESFLLILLNCKNTQIIEEHPRSGIGTRKTIQSQDSRSTWPTRDSGQSSKRRSGRMNQRNRSVPMKIDVFSENCSVFSVQRSPIFVVRV